MAPARRRRAAVGAGRSRYCSGSACQRRSVNPKGCSVGSSVRALGAARVVAPDAEATVAGADVTLDHVGSLANAGIVISRLHAGEKRLVFCDSRARVEELAVDLRNRGVNTFVSHSSLALDERRRAEEAFAEARRLRHRGDIDARAWHRRRRPRPGDPDRQPHDGRQLSAAPWPKRPTRRHDEQHVAPHDQA